MFYSDLRLNLYCVISQSILNTCFKHSHDNIPANLVKLGLALNISERYTNFTCNDIAKLELNEINRFIEL